MWDPAAPVFGPVVAYALWTATLPATGGPADPVPLGLAVALLAAGGGLVLASRRRVRG